MTTRTTPEMTADTRDYWNDLCRSRYTDPAAATAYVMRKTSDSARLTSARSLLSVARDPRNRFGLTRDDINPVVVTVLEAFVAGLSHVDAATLALALRHRDLEGQGFAQDEVWGQLEDEATPLGFSYGDSSTLRAIAAA
jgi:hypothetical protein